MISSKLNKTIVVQLGTDGVNTVGSPVFTWSDYMTTYAGVYVPSGDTRTNDDGELFVYRTEFTIRHNSKTKIINNKYRISYNDDYYKIVQVSEIGIKEGIKIIAIAFDDD
jgi:head-tail adaptor